MLTRRRLLQGGAATAAAVAAGPVTLGATRASADPLALPSDPTSDPLGTVLDTDAAVLAANRLTFGPTRELVDRIRLIGLEAYLDEQLAPELIDDSACEALLRVFPTRGKSSKELAAGYPGPSGAEQVIRELRGATVIRAAWSRRQLLEVACDLWSNHLNVFAPASHNLKYLKPADDAMVRARALGRFADLLDGSVHSTAMLLYLDQYRSDGRNPNENYARELLELHTVGSGEFTEEDVRQAALALTGMSIGYDTVEFAFKPELHHVGPVRVLGWSHANTTATGGQAVARSLIAYLAHHPATARRIARKVAVRFVADQPSESLVTSAAEVYRRTGTDLSAVIRHVILSDEFAASAGRKVRSHMELIAATQRILGASYDPAAGTTGADLVNKYLSAMGHLPFGWWQPDGYPDEGRHWLATAGMLARIEHTQHVCLRRFYGITYPAATTLMPTPRPATAGGVVDALAQRLLFGPLPAARRDALLTYIGLAADAPIPDAHYSYQLPQLVALVLASPEHQAR